MFVILHRVFFRNFFSNIKNAPLPPGRAVLLRACSCVPPSPPASGDSHSTDSGAYLQAGRAGSWGSTGTGRGGPAGLYTLGFAFTRHTPSFYKAAACWVFFFLFLFAKTIILNKCRLFVFLFSSCGRKRLGVEWAAPYFYPAVAQTPTQNLLLPWADREPVPREGHQATDGENQCP